MAYFPTCDFGPHAWLKKKHLVYVGFAQLGDTQRYRLRFCPDHLATIDEDLAQFEVGALERAVRAGDPLKPKCLTCSEPIDHRSPQLFVTCYPTQDERKDYWARVHSTACIPVYLKDPYM